MALLFTLTVCAFLAAFAEAQNTSYCAISTCESKGGLTDHTLCKYNPTVPGEACQPLYPELSQVSKADIATILKVHNDYRRKVANGLETIRGDPGPQPPASNMRKLVWDQELADVAYAWAMQCTYEHDQCRDVSRFKVGQNIHIQYKTSKITKTDWAKAITSWYNELTQINSDNVKSFRKKEGTHVGHYTQLVWATTTNVGCAVTSYKSSSNKMPFQTLYVCNYGPAGNKNNKPIYATGDPGSACPDGTTNQDGLCA